MVGYIGRFVGVTLSITVKLSVVDISGGGILITGGGRIGRRDKGEIFGKASDGVGSTGTVMMCTLLRTSQTDNRVNIWSRHSLLLVSGAEDRVNRTLTTCGSFQA